jgi:hypothetical protein
MKIADMPIKVNPLLPKDAVMMLSQDGDGVTVATPTGKKFFAWEEVRAMALKILPAQ